MICRRQSIGLLWPFDFVLIGTHRVSPNYNGHTDNATAHQQPDKVGYWVHHFPLGSSKLTERV
jgi:hypothetical protein